MNGKLIVLFSNSASQNQIALNSVVIWSMYGFDDLGTFKIPVADNYWYSLNGQLNDKNLAQISFAKCIKNRKWIQDNWIILGV